MEVMFFKGKNGDAVARIDGRIAVPGREWTDPLPRPWEEWEVQIIGENPKKTVFFLKPVRRLPSIEEKMAADQAAWEARLRRHREETAARWDTWRRAVPEGWRIVEEGSEEMRIAPVGETWGYAIRIKLEGDPVETIARIIADRGDAIRANIAEAAALEAAEQAWEARVKEQFGLTPTISMYRIFADEGEARANAMMAAYAVAIAQYQALVSLGWQVEPPALLSEHDWAALASAVIAPPPPHRFACRRCWGVVDSGESINGGTYQYYDWYWDVCAIRADDPLPDGWHEEPAPDERKAEEAVRAFHAALLGVA